MPTTTIEIYDRALNDRLAEEGLLVRSFAAHHLPEVEERLRRLARRAEKLGVEAPTLELVRLDERDGERIYTAVITTSPVRLAGWRFIATIQHAGELGNIIRRVPAYEAVELPSEYRTATSSWCDHCRTARRRTDTYVVQDDTGELRRVGRNCLADFIGSEDGASIASFWTDVAELADEISGWGPGGGEPTFDTRRFVAQAWRCVQVSGWTSRTAARADYTESKVATADLVFAVYRARENPRARVNRELASDVYRVTEDDLAFAEAALRWATSLTDDEAAASEYLANLRLACRFSAITFREAGLVASVVSAYNRHLGNELKRQREAALPPRGESWFGQPGDKLGPKLTAADKRKKASLHEPLKVTVTNVRGFDSAYGLRTLVTMEYTTEFERLVFTWWASGEPGVERGDLVVLSGSIKRHTTYTPRGKEGAKTIRQTEMTRCRLDRIPEEG